MIIYEKPGSKAIDIPTSASFDMVSYVSGERRQMVYTLQEDTGQKFETKKTNGMAVTGPKMEIYGEVIKRASGISTIQRNVLAVGGRIFVSYIERGKKPMSSFIRKNAEKSEQYNRMLLNDGTIEIEYVSPDLSIRCVDVDEDIISMFGVLDYIKQKPTVLYTS